MFSHGSSGWKSKIKVPGLVSPEVSLLSLERTSFLLPFHMAFSLCTQAGVGGEVDRRGREEGDGEVFHFL